MVVVDHASRVSIACDDGYVLPAEIVLPREARGIVVFVDGLHAAQNPELDRFVMGRLHSSAVGTLVLEPSSPDRHDGNPRSNPRSIIDLGAARLARTTRWLAADAGTMGLGVGYFASDAGTAMALIAAAELGSSIQAIVSWNGRPDLAGQALEWVQAPTFLIVGDNDHEVLAFNELAFDDLECERELDVIPGATPFDHSEESIAKLADLSQRWFEEHLTAIP